MSLPSIVLHLFVTCGLIAVCVPSIRAEDQAFEKYSDSLRSNKWPFVNHDHRAWMIAKREKEKNMRVTFTLIVCLNTAIYFLTR